MGPKRGPGAGGPRASPEKEDTEVQVEMFVRMDSLFVVPEASLGAKIQRGQTSVPASILFNSLIPLPIDAPRSRQ